MGLLNASNNQGLTIPPDTRLADLIQNRDEWAKDEAKHASIPTRDRTCVNVDSAGLGMVIQERRKYLLREQRRETLTRTLDSARPYFTSIAFGLAAAFVARAAYTRVSEKYRE